MSLLLETIKVKNKQLVNIGYHNNRLNHARKALFDATDEWDLAAIIDLPANLTDATYKCRVEYGKEVDHIEFIPYKQREIKKLFLVLSNSIEYKYKYADRKCFTNLKAQIPNTENNDILIVKNGFITDTSYSNIVFFNGKIWITPYSVLLPGTKRKFYLDKKVIEEKPVTISDLHEFHKARLINAMLDLEDSADISIDNIIGFL